MTIKIIDNWAYDDGGDDGIRACGNSRTQLTRGDNGGINVDTDAGHRLTYIPRDAIAWILDNTLSVDDVVTRKLTQRVLGAARECSTDRAVHAAIVALDTHLSRVRAAKAHTHQVTDVKTEGDAP